ncbi:MAG: CinA family protein [Clostridia bacterium]|nr:CinA family protein [Clostridia bacterium]
MDNLQAVPSYEEQVVSYLKEKGFKISFAESCTGGLACARLVSVPDASAVLKESYVTYANESKIDLLGVSPVAISEYGVVSKEVARQMAKGAAEKSGAQISVGITGVAGPSGGTEAKPVGMVCFGVYLNGMLDSKTINFGNMGRNAVREAAAQYIFKALVYLFSREE